MTTGTSNIGTGQLIAGLEDLDDHELHLHTVREAIASPTEVGTPSEVAVSVSAVSSSLLSPLRSSTPPLNQDEDRKDSVEPLSKLEGLQGKYFRDFYGSERTLEVDILQDLLRLKPNSVESFGAFLEQRYSLKEDELARQRNLMGPMYDADGNLIDPLQYTQRNILDPLYGSLMEEVLERVERKEKQYAAIDREVSPDMIQMIIRDTATKQLRAIQELPKLLAPPILTGRKHQDAQLCKYNKRASEYPNQFNRAFEKMVAVDANISWDEEFEEFYEANKQVVEDDLAAEDPEFADLVVKDVLDGVVERVETPYKAAQSALAIIMDQVNHQTDVQGIRLHPPRISIMAPTSVPTRPLDLPRRASNQDHGFCTSA